MSHSGSNSGEGSHHPSRKCFMVNTLDGHVSNDEEEATPPANSGDEAGGGANAALILQREQLCER